MSDIQKSHMVPSGKEYVGEKIKLWKEVLQKTMSEVEKMDVTAVAKKLDQYKDVIPGKENKDNTFEMMALYQRAFSHLWKNTKVDARFGPETHSNLKTIQKEKLKFSENESDGFPGPKTTKALIELLSKVESARVVVPAPTVTDTNIQRQGPAVSAPSIVAPVVPITNNTSTVWRSTENRASTLDAKVDFTIEQNKANIAIWLAKEKSMIERLSWNGNFYNGSSPKLITYAIVRQIDGESYVFDKPNQDSRIVWRLNTKNEVIGSIQIDSKWAITNVQWAPMKNVVYMPTPDIK